MKRYARLLLAFLFLPLVLIYDVTSSNRLTWKKILYVIIILIFFGSIWWDGYHRAINLVTASHSPKSAGALNSSYNAGRKDHWEVSTRGTSMLPTLKTSGKVTLYDPAKYGISRLDLVSLKNKQTDGLYYLKRVIGMPGEHYAIKNGYITINGKILKEDYVLNGLPTYGNSALMDCEEYVIPDNSYIVMGDNRTVSQDSRTIGFVDRKDIDGVIKTKLKEDYLSDAQQKNALPSNVDAKKFVEYLNSQREASTSGTLRVSSKLVGIAQKRSVLVKDKFDSWKKLELPVEQTLEKEGYRFNLAHEYVTFGYLDEKSLVDQIMESIKEKEEFTSSRYFDVGVGTSQRTVGACTYPVISVILGWPSNPDYPQSTITLWKNQVSITADNMRALQELVGNSSYDQTKLRRYITVEAQMNEIANRLYSRFKSNQWLTAQENRDYDLYGKLVTEAQSLDDDLF